MKECPCGKPLGHRCADIAECEAHIAYTGFSDDHKYGWATLGEVLNDLIALNIVGLAHDIPDPRRRKPYAIP